MVVIVMVHWGLNFELDRMQGYGISTQCTLHGDLILPFGN